MALVDNAWYVDYGDGATTGYYALTKWSNHTAVAGEIIRQFTAPAVGSERVFVCTTAGATGATEPTWVNTRGALNTSSSAVYQECTGIAALNGDATNTPSWTITATPPGGVKNTAVTLGEVIKRDSGASYQICTIAGTAGNGAEPAFSNTAGVTTADNTVTWTSLGVVGNFTGWQAPHARLANSFAATWGRAGNSFFVASEHAETQATAITLLSPGTTALPCIAYAVTKTTLPPVSANLTTGASINTTGANTINIQGLLTMRGFTVSAGSVGNTASILFNSSNANHFVIMDTCSLVLNNTSITSLIGPGAGVSGNQTAGVKLINTTMTFGSISQGISFAANVPFTWENTASALLGTLPTTLFYTNPFSNVVTFRGVDLGAYGAGKKLVGASGGPITANFIDCKLGASVTVSSTPIERNAIVNVIRCDSGATNYRNEKYVYDGTQTIETTIVRTGGASDGTTPITWKIVTTANSRWTFPYESFPISIWNDSTSAITTLTIYGTTTGGGVPKDDEIWVDVEYLGSSLTPQGSFITSSKADNLAASAATNNSSDGSTWAGGGAGNGFKIVVPTFTPGMKGPINIIVKAAKATSTYYIDPRPSISNVSVAKSEILAPGVYANELSSSPAQLINSQGLIG